MAPWVVGLVVAALFTTILIIQYLSFSKRENGYKAIEIELREQAAQLRAALNITPQGHLQGQLAQLQVQLRAKTEELQRLTQVQSQTSAANEQINQKARELYQAWVQKEREVIAAQLKEVALGEAQNQLQEWKQQAESQIRTDAIQRSQSVTLGKVTEHLAPYMPDFSYNPKDVRFIGSPVDMVIFDGMSNDELKNVIFVEVKTGASASLSKRERQIRNAISEGRVQWVELRINRVAF